MDEERKAETSAKPEGEESTPEGGEAKPKEGEGGSEQPE